MHDVKKQLESELQRTRQRIRHLDSGAAAEELRGAGGDGAALADEVDMIRINADREMTFATRSLLLERAHKLAGALERLRDGGYGVCEECGEAIAPGRLRVMPEVTTCVRCQDRLERTARRLETVGAVFGHDDGEED